MTQPNPPLRLTKDTAPDLTGAAGAAWLMDEAAITRRMGSENDPRRQVTLPAWIVRAPHAHPFWSHYAIMCVALRAMPGIPAARINLPGATHEVMVAALDPTHQPAVDDFPHVLMPLNFAGQFVAASDEEASLRVKQAVQEVVDGTLNPDTDYCSQWVDRFSASNLKTPAPPPDFIAAAPGGQVVVAGTGAANSRALQQIVNTSATLRADESNPQ